MVRPETESMAPSGSKRIGVMGGTFDPIHHGHLVAASEVADKFSLDEVIFVPTGDPWYKHTRGEQVTAAEDRYLMTVIATASNPRFRVSRVDIDRAGQTYTIDTLRDLTKIHPQAQLYFITGADALNNIFQWHDWKELFSYAKFVGVTRPGYHFSLQRLSNESEDLPTDAINLLEVPAMAISSTECRKRAQAGRPIWYLVPDGVVQYIEKGKLYLQKQNIQN